MRTKLRKAQTQDFDYCAHLYFAGMEKTIQALNLSMTAQVANFRKQWDVMQVRIITLDGADIGWVQSVTQDYSLFSHSSSWMPSSSGKALAARVALSTRPQSPARR